MERLSKDAASAPDADAVRQLLRQVLPTPRDVTAFCTDYFPRVRAGFTEEMSWEQQVEQLLIKVPDRSDLLRSLRRFAPNAAAWGPQRALWPYILCALALVTALLGGFLAWRMTMARRPQSHHTPSLAPLYPSVVRELMRSRV